MSPFIDKGFTIEEFYRQGIGVRNEDAIVCRPDIGLFAVIDGATAVVADERLSGGIASNAVKSSLDVWDGTGDLVAAIIEANRHLGQLTGVDALSKVERPSCCIAAIRWHDLSVEFAQAGDCMAFAEYKSSGIRVLTHDSVAGISQRSIQQKENQGTKSMTAYEQRVANRNMMNVAGGYSVLDGSTEAEKFIEHGVINGSFVARVLLISDGMQLPDAQADGHSRWVKTAELGFAQGAQVLGERVTEMEKDDVTCERYPRAKVHDDKSGLLVERV